MRARLFSLVLMVLGAVAPASAQVGAPIPYALPQYFDNDGDPCNGCKLEVYAAGTLTPVDTYSDAQLTTVNDNPVEMDANGRPDSGGLFLSDRAYKFVLKTAAGVTIWTVDYVTAVPLPFTVVSTATTYTVLAADGKDILVLCNASSGAVTINLYTSVGNSGRSIRVKKTDTTINACTLDPNSTQTIDGATTWKVKSANGYIHVVSDNSNWQIAARYGLNVQTTTTSYTVALDDDVVICTSGTCTFNLFTAASGLGRRLELKNLSSTSATIDPSGSETIESQSTLAVPQFFSYTVIAFNGNWNVY